jgi:hypothetical protein
MIGLVIVLGILVLAANNTESDYSGDYLRSRGRKLFYAMGVGGRLIRLGLVDRAENVYLRWRSKKLESWVIIN